MPIIFKHDSDCVCGRGKFKNMPENSTYDPPMPEGAYVKCEACQRTACVPEVYQPWKKKHDKKNK